MKTVADERLTTPVNMLAGDSIEVTYQDPGGKRHTLAAATVDKAVKVTRVKIAKFGAREVRGFKEGYVAILGEKTR